MAERTYLFYLFMLSSLTDDFVRGLLTQLPHPLPDNRVLDYSNNNIKVIDFIEYVPKMRRFNLKYNGLEEFPNFDNNTQLQLISLNGNALRSVPSNLLDNLVNLAYLNLKDNELSSFPDSPGLESLTYITLSRNKFTEFPEFRNVGRKLEAFYLSRNEITSVTEERFTYIRSVKYLSLMYNRISGKVPDFRMLEMLNHLDLSGNTFNGFDARMVDGFQNLVSVKLNMNSIKNIAGTFHLNNRTLQKSIMINLGDNPINCDCTAKWLKQAQTDESPIITSATCATPTNLFNRKLSELNITQLSCGKLYSIYL